MEPRFLALAVRLRSAELPLVYSDIDTASLHPRLSREIDRALDSRTQFRTPVDGGRSRLRVQVRRRQAE